jgi:protein TonB
VAADFALQAGFHVDDGAWHRFALVSPPVIAIWVGLLWVLGSLLVREPIAPPPKPVDARLIELPSEAPPQEIQPPHAPPPLARVPQPVPTHVQKPPEPAPVPNAASVEAQPQPALPAPAPQPQPISSGPIAARAIYSPLPKIPDELRDRASSAEALARFTIGADGRVSVELVTPTLDSLLNRAILETLRTWRFAPATENGKPVASSQVLRIRVEVR